MCIKKNNVFPTICYQCTTFPLPYADDDTTFSLKTFARLYFWKQMNIIKTLKLKLCDYWVVIREVLTTMHPAGDKRWHLDRLNCTLTRYRLAMFFTINHKIHPTTGTACTVLSCIKHANTAIFTGLIPTSH